MTTDYSEPVLRVYKCLNDKAPATPCPLPAKSQGQRYKNAEVCLNPSSAADVALALALVSQAGDQRPAIGGRRSEAGSDRRPAIGGRRSEAGSDRRPAIRGRQRSEAGDRRPAIRGRQRSETSSKRRGGARVDVGAHGSAKVLIVAGARVAGQHNGFGARRGRGVLCRYAEQLRRGRVLP